jgi:DNA-binding NarL/FixJ family response regulator
MARIVRLLHRRTRNLRQSPPGRRCPPLQVWLLSRPSREIDDLAASLEGFRALRVRVVAPEDLPNVRTSSGDGPPRIVLLDRSMGDRAVLDAVQTVRERYPETPVVMLRGVNDPRSTAQIMLRSGARGFADPRRGVDHIACEILAALAQRQATDRSVC